MDMSPLIMEESRFMLHAVLTGILITFVYDMFRLLRRVIKHGVFWISMEDLLFWTACSIGIFALFYKENNGTFRWFAVIGAAAGMFCYKKTVSTPLVEGGAKLLGAVLGALGKAAGILLTPLKKAERWRRKRTAAARRKAAGRLRLWKKQLTLGMKLVKMTLCKRATKQSKAGDHRNGKKKTRIS